MTGHIPQSPRAAARALATSQHEVITRRQLLELGFTRHAVNHKLETGRLHPIFEGVYAVGRPSVTSHGHWMAAVLACGPLAVLSHMSAAALWRIWPNTRREIEISVPGHVDRRRPGIIVHRRSLLGRTDLTRHDGIPVTSPACTLVDIAPMLSRIELDGAVSAADKLGLVDPETLREAIDSMPRRAGMPKLRDALDRHTYVMTDTELERRFLPIARRAGLPLPKTQVYVNGYRVDFFWPGLGLVVETDGLRYHRTPAQQSEDRRRDQAHMAAGLVPLRFTRAQVRFEPGHVEDVLRAVARRLLAARSAAAAPSTL
jgi:very-short-patch-repair endonuclease